MGRQGKQKHNANMSAGAHRYYAKTINDKMEDLSKALHSENAAKRSIINHEKSISRHMKNFGLCPICQKLIKAKDRDRAALLARVKKSGKRIYCTKCYRNRMQLLKRMNRNGLERPSEAGQQDQDV